MQTSKQKSAARGTLAAVAAGIATAALSFAAAQAEDAKSPYPNMAPIEQYRSASQADEVALAKSAAPPAISNSAEVLIMGERGYETAVKGTNGFVCLVQRSWASDFTSNEFWNPKMRGPECFNPAAARSVLPSYLERTRWVLAGATEAEVIERTKAALAAKKIGAPEVGAMAYMMSKDQYLNDSGVHWHPHLMFFLPRMAPTDWGADIDGGAVFSDTDDPGPVVTFFVPVRKWSDGTFGPGMPGM
jgi:hypothetical protein